MYPLVPLALDTSNLPRQASPPPAPVSASLDIPKSASFGRKRCLPSAQNPNTLTRFMWLILPMTATSAQNSASPWVTPSSLLTATATCPKPPLPISSLKFVVAFFNSV
ncbi:unnamed protein product [Spirodela intermedia]|uniref:Uncharacterized protein n=2 Tax=Spirodela intermedia TaxID=51605 RepID=A0A7I8KT84_SPIIN|nr:unnamed protein product [Spirodela intermedia]CAA6664467.1 unnamed protein product [Spirodela intermedia]CAA7401049.1 unnamed protein product [Spirodela intermedia]